MKATLTFILPDERPEFLLSIEAPNMLAALRDVVEHVRRRRKYECGLGDDAIAELDQVWRVLEEAGAIGMVYEL